MSNPSEPNAPESQSRAAFVTSCESTKSRCVYLEYVCSFLNSMVSLVH